MKISLAWYCLLHSASSTGLDPNRDHDSSCSCRFVAKEISSSPPFPNDSRIFWYTYTKYYFEVLLRFWHNLTQLYNLVLDNFKRFQKLSINQKHNIDKLWLESLRIRFEPTNHQSRKEKNYYFFPIVLFCSSSSSEVSSSGSGSKSSSSSTKSSSTMKLSSLPSSLRSSSSSFSGC